MRALHIKTPPAISNATSANNPPLTPEHLRQIEDARTRSKKVRRAASVAKVSGWTLAIFAVITLMFALFGDLSSLVSGAALGAIAFNELRGGKMIARFDPNGARVLAINQLVLGALIVAYSGWSLYSASSSPILSQLNAGVVGDADSEELARSIASFATYGLYGTLAVVGFLGCGLTALYYLTRARVVREMVSGTPAWVLETMKAAA